jgi:glycosyltransferase involved in cell wall biosynthesis
VKIVFVLTQSLESPSGLGRYGPLARELVRLGHRVTVLALHPAWERLSSTQVDDAGVRVVYAGQMHVRKEGARKTYYSPGRFLQVSLAATARLARALASASADIIHVGKPQPYNLLAARLARRGRLLYVDCDDYEAETNRFSGRWQQRVVRYFEDSIVRDAVALTVNTRFTAQRYQALGVPEQHIVYVPNGVDRQRFAGRPDPAPLRRKLGLSPETPVVLYVGTMGLHSHPVNLLLEGFQRVCRSHPSAHLLLVGGGEDYDRLQQMAVELGIGERTLFTGRVPPADVPAYLALATLTVDPVHDDLIARARSPLKVVEGIAKGVPVITADVGDRREMLAGGEVGMLVPAGDSAALGDAVLALLNDPARRGRMTAAALAGRERWYWDRLVHDFAQVYQVRKTVS